MALRYTAAFGRFALKVRRRQGRVHTVEDEKEAVKLDLSAPGEIERVVLLRAVGEPYRSTTLVG